MGAVEGPGVWARFEHDPRLPDHRGLRSAARDRDVISGVLAEAFADGRLDREELDERSDALAATKTLGELPPLVADLVSAHGAAARPAVPSMRAQAEARYVQRRNAALLSFLVPTLVCWVIWAATMPGGFPWPLFVMLGTGLGGIRSLVGREAQVQEIERVLVDREERREHQRRRRLES